MNKGLRNLLGVALILVVVFYLMLPLYRRHAPSQEIAYSDFLDRARSGQIVQVTIGSEAVSGQLKDGRPFRVYVPTGDTSYTQLLQTKGVTITVEPHSRSSLWPSLLTTMLPFLVLVGLWTLMLRQPQSGPNQANAVREEPGAPAYRNQDRGHVRRRGGRGRSEGGTRRDHRVSPAPEEVRGARREDPARRPARWAAGQREDAAREGDRRGAGVPFFSISGSEFVEMFVGVGASRVRDLFAQAKKSAPCLVFIDEIDAVGRQRGAGLGGGHDEREQTLNQLLVEMDGFAPNSGIIVIAATNRPDILDSALLRPGRFDRRLVVDNPDTKGRRAILDVHARGKPIGDDANLDVLARRTPGFSGADLANMANEAVLLAARRGKKRIGMSEFDEAMERVIAGPQRKSRILSPKERELTAYHEGGHALLGKLLPQANPPHKVTILARGMALGYVIALPQEEKYTVTRSEILAHITAMLGGRVAEEIIFGEITTGAANDFENATDLARRMVTEFGMSDRLGPLTLGTKHGPVFLGRDLFESRNYSDEIAYEIDKEVRRIIDECYSRARAVLTEHKETLDRIAKALLERESLQSDELDTLIARQPLLPDLPALAASTPSLVSQDVTSASGPEKPIPPTLGGNRNPGPDVPENV